MYHLCKTALAVFFFAMPFFALAQEPPGISEIYEVSGEIVTWYFAFSDLALVIGTIAGICGGIRIYVNWQIGRPHIDSQVISWFLSCLFLSMLGGVLKAFFGI